MRKVSIMTPAGVAGGDAVGTASAALHRAGADAAYARHERRRRSVMHDGSTLDVSTSLFYNWTATRIQAWYRGRVCRRRFLYVRRCIMRVQRAFRDYADRLRRRVTPNEAAKTIQHAWRSHSSRRVYRYYRDMVAAVERRGDPRSLLRAAFPHEAQLADAAAGVHVRFRLGGEAFPPVIYFKIYTHRPVADVGAFAPRDYVREAARKRKGRASRHTLAQQATHVLGSGLPEALPASTLRSLTAATGGGGNGRTRVPPDWEVEISAWYRRIENNGWRPLTERLAGQAAAGELGRVPRRQAHWPVLRAERKTHRDLKADREAKQRRRRREWMMSLYRQGRRAEGGGGEGEGAEDGAAADLTADVDLDGLPSDDGELEELVSWSKGLDFDSYTSDWQTCATSAGSEGTLDMLNLDVAAMEVLLAEAESVKRSQSTGSAAPSTAPTAGKDEGLMVGEEAAVAGRAAAALRSVALDAKQHVR